MAASKKSSSRETNTLARMKGGTEDARRQRKNELLQTMFKLPLLLRGGSGYLNTEFRFWF